MPVHPLYAMFQLNTAVVDLERFRGPPPDHIPAAGSAVLATCLLSLLRILMTMSVKIHLANTVPVLVRILPFACAIR